MRIFTTYPEAFGEIKRELKEMGINVHTKTMQNKDISGDRDFETVEIQNYQYCVTQPNTDDLNPSQPWADAEFAERVAGVEGRSVNPGEAYKLRPEIWNEFLVSGAFDYSYSERFSSNNQVKRVIGALKNDPLTRQANIQMWKSIDSTRLGVQRVPCSLNWLFQYRGGKLDMTYFMRSCDFHTHFNNDVYLARKLQEYVADKAGMEPGRYMHHMASLHVYAKDVKEAF